MLHFWVTCDPAKQARHSWPNLKLEMPGYDRGSGEGKRLDDVASQNNYLVISSLLRAAYRTGRQCMNDGSSSHLQRCTYYSVLQRTTAPPYINLNVLSPPLPCFRTKPSISSRHYWTAFCFPCSASFRPTPPPNSTPRLCCGHWTTRRIQPP